MTANHSTKDLFQSFLKKAEENQIAEEYDVEPIEKELLAGALQESGMPNAIAPDLILSGVQPENLQSQELRLIAEVVWPFLQARSPLNAKVIPKLFCDKPMQTLIGELMGATYDVAMFPLYIEQLQNSAQSRDVRRALTPIVKTLLYTQKLDSNRLANLVFQARADLVVPVHHSLQVVSERDELLEYFKSLEDKQQERDFTGFDSGFKHINRVINGLCTGLIVIAGFPGAGKTTLFKQMHTQVAVLNEIPVIFISYEQSKDELRVKDLSRLSKVINRDILRGKHDTEMENWSKVQVAAAEVFSASALQYIVEADQRWDVNRIRAYVECVMAQNETDKCVVFIDYLQKIPPSANANTSSRRDEVSLVCSDLTRMARDLRVPVIAISSESRASYNRKGLDVFKESGEVEYSADVAGVLHVEKKRSEEYTKKFTKIHEKRRAVDLCIVKNRSGEQARITFDFYPQFGLFKETGSENYEFHECLPEGGGK